MSFLNNVLKLGSGNLIAQAISLGAMPIITRLYSPEEFGVFALYLSVTMVLFPISNLRYSSAILLPEDQEDAAILAIVGILATIVFSLAIAPICILVVQEYAGYTGHFEILLWFIALGTLIQGITQCLQFFGLRQKRFGSMAKAAVAESVSDRALVIGMGLNVGGAISLILGRLVGPLVHCIVLCRSGVCRDIRLASRGITFERARSIAVRYKNFPLYSSWALLFGNGARELPIVLLTAMYSPAVAGAYALGMRVMNWPMLMIGDAIGKVFFQSMSENQKDICKLKHDAQQMLKYITYLMLPPMFFLVVFGREAFVFVFGEKWSDAGFYVEILAISFYLTFATRVLSIFFDIYEKQSKRLMLHISLFVVRGASVIIGGWYADITGAIAGLLIGTALVNLLTCSYLFTLVGVSIKQFGKIMSSNTLLVFPTLLMFLAIEKSVDSGYLLVSLVTSVGVLFQLSVLMMFDKESVNRFLMLRSSAKGSK